MLNKINFCLLERNATILQHVIICDWRSELEEEPNTHAMSAAKDSGRTGSSIRSKATLNEDNGIDWLSDFLPKKWVDVV